ncbi:MAG: class I SAM-dependent methyltransferase [Synergistaceae bacterium]|nr:class I SAM-dependent methyltransferase [Synergistaceae bacterium]
MRNIISFKVAPENFEVEHMDAIPQAVLDYSKMHLVERRFINGLIRLLKPRRVLELGVAEGAGSVVILNAISDMSDTTLTSFDTRFKLWYTPEKNVGFAFDMMYPGGNKQWTLHKGADFSQYADTFSEPFDMVIIDTVHLHPVESLNFLTVLPYLSEQAAVVFHDLALYTLQDETLNAFPNVCLANKLAYDTIVGEKLKPSEENYLEDCHGFASIGVVQVSPDTKKYIRNIFDMLYFPWPSYDYLASPFMNSVAKIIKKNYAPELFEQFCAATMVNAMFIANDYKYVECDGEVAWPHERLRQANKTVFYGAGYNCGRLLWLFERNGLDRPVEIWDIAARDKQPVENIPVVLPPFPDISAKYADTIIVITIGDADVSRDVKNEILSRGPGSEVYEWKEVVKSVLYAKVSELAAIEEDD